MGCTMAINITSQKKNQFFVNGKKGVTIISVNDIRTFIDQPALSKETFSIVFFCGQDCCFIPVYYMVQGDGVLIKSRLFWSLILDRSLVFGKARLQVSFSLAYVNKRTS